MTEITPERVAAIRARITRATGDEIINESEAFDMLHYMALDCRALLDDISDLVVMLTHAYHLAGHGVKAKYDADTNYCGVCREIIRRVGTTSARLK